MSKPRCVQPAAPSMPCVVCGKPVKTCERAVPISCDGGYDYTCPAHPDGCEIIDHLGEPVGWVCGDACYDEAERRMGLEP